MKRKAGVARCDVSHETTELDHPSNCNIKGKNAAAEQSTEEAALCCLTLSFAKEEIFVDT